MRYLAPPYSGANYVAVLNYVRQVIAHDNNYLLLHFFYFARAHV